jgi:hypothetical protein
MYAKLIDKYNEQSKQKEITEQKINQLTNNLNAYKLQN